MGEDDKREGRAGDDAERISRALRFETEDGPELVRTMMDSLLAKPLRTIGGWKASEVSQPDATTQAYELEGDAVVEIRVVEDGAALRVDVLARLQQVDADDDPALLTRAHVEAEARADAILQNGVLNVLKRAEIHIPSVALALSDEVGIEKASHFFGVFLPDLEIHVQELRAGHISDEDLRAWVAEALDGYGDGARERLRPGFDAYLTGLRALVGDRAVDTLNLIGELFAG